MSMRYASYEEFQGQIKELSKKEMREKGLTQGEFGQAIGYHPEKISRILSGSTRLTIETANDFLRYFNMPLLSETDAASLQVRQERPRHQRRRQVKTSGTESQQEKCQQDNLRTLDNLVESSEIRLPDLQRDVGSLTDVLRGEIFRDYTGFMMREYIVLRRVQIYLQMQAESKS